MYSIFFHLLWLSLLEVIFYFEYIGPLETNTYKKTIKRLIHNKNDLIEFDNYTFNTSKIIHIDNSDFNANQAQEDRESYNNELYVKSIHYWLILFGIIMSFSGITIFYKYRQYLERKKEMDINSREIEFITVRNRTFTQESDELSDNNNNINFNSEEIFIDYKKIKKQFMKKSIFYIGLGLLIIGFEYLFFNYIVMKYKILSDDEILYQIYKLIEPFIDTMIQNEI